MQRELREQGLQTPSPHGVLAVRLSAEVQEANVCVVVGS